MSLTKSLKSLRSSFEPVVKRHVMISLLLIVGFLIFTIYSINQILSDTTDPEYENSKQAEAINTRFDDSTIDKINQLKSRQEAGSLELPDGRRNPFIE